MAECNTMKAGKALVVTFCLIVPACTNMTFGDGGMFFRRKTYTYADVFQPTQKVYIRWDGSQEKLLIQTKYEGPAEEMVWLIPIPSQPTVNRADGAVFQDLSKETSDPAIDYTDFIGLDLLALGGATGGIGGGSGPGPVEWHERIGDYDVVLLRPVGGEDVIQWLNTNDFVTPEKIDPILEDYVREGWWMVAAKIHPDALTPITRDKLAKGTLHPLEMTFESSACVYPMRLTSTAAGPVEELIYIEGPNHYEPATGPDDDWEIRLFGGPVRKVPQDYYLSDLEHAVEILEGRTRTEARERLTKLRRVFQPSEMTEDLVFRAIDLAQWLASKDLVPLTPPTTPPDRRPDPRAQMEFTQRLLASAPFRIAQAATQYGRWRDPNGVAPVLNALSPEALDRVKPAPEDYQTWSSPSAKFLSVWGAYKWSWPLTEEDWLLHPGCGPLRTCIWALGEIALEHQLGDAAESVLLDCAQHDNQLIRMEAYIALTKLHSERLGPILGDRLSEVFQNGPVPILWLPNLQFAVAEMDIIADWVARFGAVEQKEAYVNILSGLIDDIGGDPMCGIIPELRTPLAYYWWQWIVWRVACTQDARLLPTLERFRSRFAPDQAYSPVPFVLRAEAACGSVEATAVVVRQILDDEAGILSEGQAPGTGGIMSLDNFYVYNVPPSLRVQILRKRGLAYTLYPMPLPAGDLTIRSALSEKTVSDWYALYLLTGIKRPQVDDRERLTRIWDNQDGDHQLLVIDVLYVWGDEQMLMDLYDEAEFGKVKSEIAWALAELEIPEAGSIIEEQVQDSWNPEWLSLGQSFIHASTARSRGYLRDSLPVEIRRKEQALWDYFHPASGMLDDKRLAALKRLTADPAIHAGMRFDLLGMVYGGTDWGLPLLEKAAREILTVDSSDTTVDRIIWVMESVGNSGFVIDSSSD